MPFFIVAKTRCDTTFGIKIDSVLHVSLDESCLILEEEGHPFQVLRQLEESQLGVQKENFLGSYRIKWMACVEHLSTHPSMSLKREVFNGMTSVVLPET